MFWIYYEFPLITSRKKWNKPKKERENWNSNLYYRFQFQDKWRTKPTYSLFLLERTSNSTIGHRYLMTTKSITCARFLTIRRSRWIEISGNITTEQCNEWSGKFKNRFRWVRCRNMKCIWKQARISSQNKQKYTQNNEIENNILLFYLNSFQLLNLISNFTANTFKATAQHTRVSVVSQVHMTFTVQVCQPNDDKTENCGKRASLSTVTSTISRT